MQILLRFVAFVFKNNFHRLPFWNNASVKQKVVPFVLFFCWHFVASAVEAAE